jgi:hypothetical protein
VSGVPAALAAGVTGVLLTAPALGQEETLRQALLRNQAGPEAALYETVDGEHVFVLDRTGDPPLLKFESSFEVYALDQVPASRGDELLRTDTGEDLVRVTMQGAVTLYPTEKPTGLPATRLGPADPLPALADTRPDIVEAFRLLTIRSGGVEVDAPVATAAAPEANAIVADAVRLTAEGLRASAESDAAGKAEVVRIAFVFGAGADARVEDGALVIQLDPERGYAGRPSSLKVAEALADGG